jgi:hypothetical protein
MAAVCLAAPFFHGDGGRTDAAFEDRALIRRGGGRRCFIGISINRFNHLLRALFNRFPICAAGNFRLKGWLIRIVYTREALQFTGASAAIEASFRISR